MALINLDNLEPGMILATEVKDRSGRVLLSAGSEVTEKVLRIFKMWGVTEADIQGVEKADIEAKTVASLRPESLRSAELHVNTLFQLCDQDDQVIKELKRIAVIRAARKEEDNNASAG
jgi:hypothetical protein